MQDHQTEVSKRDVRQREPERDQVDAMISEGGHVFRPDEKPSPHVREPNGVQRMTQRWSRAWREQLAQAIDRFAKRTLAKLAQRRQQGWDQLGQIPARMHRVANQSSLLIELVDDYKSGRYRKPPRHTIAVAAGALLYAINPADLIPETIPILGAIDDVAVMALAMQYLRKDLERYCEFKGYDVQEYFPRAA